MHIVKAVKGFVGKHLMVKEWLNDPQLTERRKQTCYGCKFYDKDQDSCKICLCLIETKSRSKVSINVFSMPPHYEDTHCPMGKWPIRNESGEIGGSDLEVANYWRDFNGKSRIE